MALPTTLTLDAAASPEATAHLNTMLFALQAALRLPPTSSPELEACVTDALAAYDRYVAHVVAAHPMSCRAGCTACCHDNPRGVTGVELRRLRAAIAEFPDADTILAHFAALAARTTDAATWRKLREPCPLLSAAGRCRAYDARPIACRAFFALTPPGQCSPDDPLYESRVNPHLDPPKVLVQALHVLSQRLGLVPSTDLHAGLGREWP